MCVSLFLFGGGGSILNVRVCAYVRVYVRVYVCVYVCVYVYARERVFGFNGASAGTGSRITGTRQQTSHPYACSLSVRPRIRLCVYVCVC